ncbi:hypothetical protein CAPGI0001_1450 [Capnocytophaga gingivalis ATCC 33624]|uniref:helix-turn-helix transcriptional regulator n=1 Tax=Capnocytophaga gingivalis TaxID=1017 RepID=UPI00019FA16B|nr:WYL domain-containing protein [Capnocytophaga gingivalis]EEK15010.1 hypothetical protein CAPGI0001_1450 [Capnocytophaga gingivalis ATCC 33624]
MATNKNAQLRYKILDECFANIDERYYIEDLIYTCEEKLSQKGKKESISKRTILDDIKFMKSREGYNAPIESIKDEKDKRKSYYRYRDSDFSIFKKELSNSDKETIREALPLLLRMKDMEGFNWVEEVVSKMELFLEITSQKKIIDFQDNNYLIGIEYLHKLYHYILKEKCLEITYKPFQKEENKIKISPYYLKQYNNRWFLFGREHISDKLKNLALDRIVSIRTIKGTFVKNTINFEEYFEEIIGVTNYEDRGEEDILIKLDEKTIPYVITKPLHPSQKIKGDELRLKVKQNPELISIILSFGMGMTVIEPRSLRDKIKNIIQDSVNQYNI